MKGLVKRAWFAAVLSVAAIVLQGGSVMAAIGNSSSRHNMTAVPGYPFRTGVCEACHKPHRSSGKRLWAGDKENRGDNQRNLGPAKAASLDQSAGPNDYPGIYLCLDCHGGSSAEPSWAAKPGYAAARVSTHSTREMNAAGYQTKRESFVVQCTTCHDPHKHWTGSFKPGENGYMVMTGIKTPNSGLKGVIFTALSGEGSLGVGSRPTKALCEVCHTTTIYHNNTSHASHNNGKRCTSCHLHTGGFAVGLVCNACHGNPPASSDTIVGGSSNPGNPPTGAQTAGMHAYHAYSTLGGAGYGCAVCHRGGMSVNTPNNKVIDVRFQTFTSKAFTTFTSGRFDGFRPVNGYRFSFGNTTGGALTCRNVYCHGNFSGGNLSNAPVWNNAATSACGTCHATAPPGLVNHSVHLTAPWGPMAACEDCHPANSSTGRHAAHVDGAISFKDGKPLAATTVCNRCHNCTASTKPFWGYTSRSKTSWCESCHNGGSIVNTINGTGGADAQAPNVVGDGLTYGFDVTGHGRTGITAPCVACHDRNSVHINGVFPTYRASLNNYKTAYRLSRSNTIPLLSLYSSARVALCYACHQESHVVGMPSDGRPSAFHTHSIPIRTDRWYTNFRNTSSTAGALAGNWDNSGNPDTGYVPDVPTNIHWNHLDDFGSTKRGQYFARRVFDSDGDGVGDSNIVCETCHNVHGTNQPAMVLDVFSLKTFSALANQSANPSYRWLGSSAYSTTRCTQVCHLSGDAYGTAGTKWYREPTGLSGVTGIPLGLTAEPLP